MASPKVTMNNLIKMLPQSWSYNLRSYVTAQTINREIEDHALYQSSFGEHSYSHCYDFLLLAPQHKYAGLLEAKI